MSNLDTIIENINNKNLDLALQLCSLYEDSKNKHIIYNFKGVIYSIKNELDIAEKNFLESSKINQNFKEPLENLYIIYLKKKKFINLLTIAENLSFLDKTNSSNNFKLAYAFELNKKFDEAIKFYKLNIEFNGKEKKQSLNNIGSIYLNRKKLKTSLNFFTKAYEIDRKDKIIVNNLLRNYIRLRDKNNSKIFYDIAKNLDIKYSEFEYNKCEYFILNDNIDDALELLNKNKDKNNFLLLLIETYIIIGKYKEADKLLKTARIENIKKIDPKFGSSHGLLLLYNGEFEKGWNLYDRRPSNEDNTFNNINNWNGENIVNKNIIVYNEQGLGDAIQFSKYLIPLKNISNNVNFFVQDGISDLFRNDIEKINIRSLNSVDDVNSDFKISLGSLLKFFYKEKLDPSSNMINYDEQKIAEWNKKIPKNKLNVGIVWSAYFFGTGQPYRSIPLKQLSKILSLDINFYCLQKEIWNEDLDYFNNIDITNFGDEKLKSIAGIIPNLDLIISVDTSLLHLSASLNKETWGLLSISPDWRWGEFNKINPYQSLKLFRQNEFNNWDNILNTIYMRLVEKIKLK